MSLDIPLVHAFVYDQRVHEEYLSLYALAGHYQYVNRCY